MPGKARVVLGNLCRISKVHLLMLLLKDFPPPGLVKETTFFDKNVLCEFGLKVQVYLELTFLSVLFFRNARRLLRALMMS